MQLLRSLVRGAALLFTLGAMDACGGDSATGPKGDQLSQAEAQQVAMNLFHEVDNALSTFGAFAPTAAARSVATQPTQSFSSNCTNGGTLTGSFTYTDNLDSQGTGSVSGSITITPNGCKVSTGTRLIAVGGSINFSFSLAFTQGVQSGDFTFHGGGAFTWSGGNCPMDYTVTLTPAGNETISGTLCGETINVSA
jgi:hypothetical protein